MNVDFPSEIHGGQKTVATSLSVETKELSTLNSISSRKVLQGVEQNKGILRNKEIL